MKKSLVEALYFGDISPFSRRRPPRPEKGPCHDPHQGGHAHRGEERDQTVLQQCHPKSPRDSVCKGADSVFRGGSVWGASHWTRNGSYDDSWAMHPPFSFRSCRKENGPCTVQKKRPLGRAPVQWPSALTGVGVPVPAPILPSLRARLGLLRFPQLPTRGGWCGGRRGGYRIVSASLFAAAGRWLMKASAAGR